MSNSSARSVTPLVLEPGPSPRVRLVTIAGFLLALLSVVVVPVPLPMMVTVCVLLIIAFASAWKKHHALSGYPVTVRLDSDGKWLWQQGEQADQVTLLGDSFHVPFLVILNFKPEFRRRPVRSLLLTTDNIDADTFRRLRVHLNWQENRGAK